MTQQLNGRIALVTGSSRGIGTTIVAALAGAGASVYAHARESTPQFIDQMGALGRRHGVEIWPIAFDLRDSAAMKQVVTSIPRTPGLDILVNNAGVAHGGLAQMTPMATIREVFDINFFAQIELTQLLLRRMSRTGTASVINVASIAGLDLRPGNIAYGTSKAALIAATKTMAAEMARSGVRFNAIAPGLTDTDMAGQMDPAAGTRMVEDSAMKRLALPEEIANAVVFLASDAASFINGQVLRLDGGSA